MKQFVVEIAERERRGSSLALWPHHPKSLHHLQLRQLRLAELSESFARLPWPHDAVMMMMIATRQLQPAMIISMMLMLQQLMMMMTKNPWQMLLKVEEMTGRSHHCCCCCW
jgi:hypothetical protein